MNHQPSIERTITPAAERVGYAKIKVGRVAAGSVLIGIFLAAADFVTQNYILPGQWEIVLQRYKGDASLVGGTVPSELALMVIANLAIGFSIMATYAGILPRFGAGLATATKAALLVFLPSAVMLAGFGGWLLPWSMYISQAAILLLTFVGAGCVGALVYSDGVK